MSETAPLMPRRREVHPVPYDPDYKTSVVRSPKQALLSLESTLIEETGPVFGHDLLGPLDNNLIYNFTQGAAPAVGERIRVHGRVLDETGRAVPNTLVEVWQANAGGRYRHVKDTYFAPLDPNFGGCGRTITDENGYYEFMTIRPGAYPWPNRANDWRPMHIHFSIFGSGFGQRLISQMYFQGDPLIDLCPIVNTIKDRGQIDRLVAPLDMQNSRGMDYIAYKFDIVLRGRRQTMFENKPEGM
ncbi:protocatechuate 3,4-dioxygenase subunit beta [Ponticoccus sp. SC2-23]|uniref:protocatechuate 3,4-dioxygenase subunit beta n=1 Tax=Alexandriicola marinus TaxID=2081710 RepID=UPI000FD81E2D|nr:protocatechuate 3,4-dioxygenase subunit beta [Alexandriicola marinus]MBM1221797.1 protocatechuate 3,4-dioxygenase subunit beta [Ponticoccus sp. SC6-9]MBM1226148.1 protocatechuate 3,4-dioxygenase subunit beta [Ponticoccus sp. SC6-15]MBM1230744.1 protocatechuate 3,4-dioxygenase subunit beta [Ponticoccus sp. SC6-38]MBM1235415.1 protocatechuate 3,4-dioxygenase subunit beta [Ponticoccus sp. SC6-45]MBM1239766.1 protocatechuate 3,4-dioxygenase subunit beta [Ponticoccus sp. SC6-49]MBM1243910.1 pro